MFSSNSSFDDKIDNDSFMADEEAENRFSFPLVVVAFKPDEESVNFLI